MTSVGVFTNDESVRPVTKVAQQGPGQLSTALTQISYTVPLGAQRSNVIAPARLTNYLVSHGEYSNSLSRQVMASYIVNQVPESATKQYSAENSAEEAFE